MNNEIREQFFKNRAIPIKDVVSKELASFLSHVLLRAPIYRGQKDDTQVPGAAGILDHEYVFETLQERIWPLVENVIGEELIPTYSYARLYANGCDLKKHTDRPACEISVTVQLARSHHYSWPIWMGGKRYDLGEGDGVIYLGEQIEHWREPCDGPEGYLSGQVFFHFVRKNGPHIMQANDRRPESTMYIRNQQFIFEGK